MEERLRPGRLRGSQWLALALIFLASSEMRAQEGLFDTPAHHIIQLRVNSGDGDFTLYVPVGTPAFISVDGARERGIAFVPVLRNAADARIELHVFKHGGEGLTLDRGEPHEVREAQIGFPSYLLVPHLVEIEPLGVLTVERGGQRRPLAKSGSATEPLGPQDWLCCISSGGVTTCGCAVIQGEQSCCSGPCCSIFK